MQIKERLVFASPEPSNLFCYSPSLVQASPRELLCSFDIGGPGIAMFKAEMAYSSTTSRRGFTVVMSSRDGGRNWRKVDEVDLWHGRLFTNNGDTFLMGHAGDLRIAKRVGGGRRFGRVVSLSEGETWHGCGSNVLKHFSRIFVPFEQRVDRDIGGWNIAGMRLGVLFADVEGDLMSPKSWKRVQAPINSELAQSYEGTWARFWNRDSRFPLEVLERTEAPAMGFLEAQLIDPRGRADIVVPDQKTLMIVARAHTGATGMAGILLLRDAHSKQPRIEPPVTPSGSPFTLIPFPGGQLKTSIIFDGPSGRFWMAANLPVDSLSRQRPVGFVGLPNNERHCLWLFHSYNALEWIPASPISQGESSLATAHYPVLEVLKDSLLIAVRRGTAEARDNQYSNSISLFQLRDFRSHAKL